MSKLAVCLFESCLGATGAQVLEVLFSKGRASLRELQATLKWPLSTLTRTLSLLCYKRFILAWQEPQKPCTYSVNFREIYTLLWHGEMLALAPKEHQEVLLQAVTNAPLTSAEITLDSKIPFLRPVQTNEFAPVEELRSACHLEAQKQVSADPTTMGLSETAKQQQVNLRAQNAIEQKIKQMQVPQPPLVIDWTQFLSAARRIALVEYSATQLGRISSLVYEEVLNLLSKTEISGGELAKVRIPAQDTIVSTLTITAKLKAKLGSNIDQILESAFLEPAVSNNSKKGPGQAMKQVKPPTTLDLVNRHLSLLSNSSNHRFLKRVGTKDYGEWFVDFNMVISDLQQTTFDNIVKNSFGSDSLRLLRIIRGVGKLDEKTLATKALLPALTIRQYMTQLSANGFVDVQELSKPGEGKSQPNQKRSVYLWYHRPQFSYKQLVQILYDQIHSSLEQRKTLRKQHHPLLAKLGRADVSADVELLTPEEKIELADFKQREADLLMEIGLMDRTIRLYTEY